MILFFRSVRLPVLAKTIGSIFILLTTNAHAIPVGDAYETGQAEFQGSPAFQPRNEVPPVFHPSLHPSSNNKINEEQKRRINEHDIFKAVTKLHQRVKGAYAAIGMIPGYGIFGFRDPNGIRPLILGERTTN